MPSETLFGIAKQYEISVDELNNANPELAATVLKAGQKIKIPVKLNSITNSIPKKETSNFESKKEVVQKETLEKSISTPVATRTATTIHEVMPSETKFGIAKQYGISIADIDRANPILEKEALKAGQKIVIPVNEGIAISKSLIQPAEVVISKKIEAKENAKVEIVAEKEVSVQENRPTLTHQVLPKETKFGIAKKYGITVAELENQNPSIQKNLFVGAQLTISGVEAIQEDSANPKGINTESLNAVTNQENLTIASSVAKWNTNEELADELIRMASDNLGSRYRPGGTSKNGFDCSGLMYSTFSSLDIKLPRSSVEMATIGTIVDPQEAKKGDLIFFKTRGGNQINHVGMIVEVCDGEIRFIHSSTQSGVIISSTKEKYYEKNFTQINRVIQQ
jgi:cell wall-associated NlpC family hydrolase